MSEKQRIAEVDFDSAEYIGNEEDGVYIAVAKGKDGWYVSTDVDCNSASFCEPLVSDDGPYATEAEAQQAGRNGATDWCIDNDVDYDEPTTTRVLPRCTNSHACAARGCADCQRSYGPRR